MAFFGSVVLYTLTIHIIVIVSAFKESVGTGFLTMCVPFYAIYYVFRVSESGTLQILYASALIVDLALKFAKFD